MDESKYQQHGSGILVISALLFIVVIGIIVIIFSPVGEYKQPVIGDPVGTVYSNGTYIRTGGLTEPLALNCEQMANATVVYNSSVLT